MTLIDVYLESGKKKSFACAVNWPGWCRGGGDEPSALGALVEYASRFAGVLEQAGVAFQAPENAAQCHVIERLEGNITTDFGAPAVIPAADRLPLEEDELRRWTAVLEACWQAFDRAAGRAAGRELRTGPRGGGRDLDKIVRHVLEGEGAYLARLAWRHKPDSSLSPQEQLPRMRQAALEALESAARNGLPEQGPRGGTIWPVRYFIRRAAWHALDHAWEIEDRIL